MPLPIQPPFMHAALFASRLMPLKETQSCMLNFVCSYLPTAAAIACRAQGLVIDLLIYISLVAICRVPVAGGPDLPADVSPGHPAPHNRVCKCPSPADRSAGPAAEAYVSSQISRSRCIYVRRAHMQRPVQHVSLLSCRILTLSGGILAWPLSHC